MKSRICKQDPRKQATRSSDVSATRAILGDGMALLIGGQKRTNALRNLEAAFGCCVEHIATTPHSRLEHIAGRIERARVVLLLIRFCSHSYKPQTTRICFAAGVPLVLLPSGLGVERVAHAIVEQAGIRLAGHGRRT